MLCQLCSDRVVQWVIQNRYPALWLCDYCFEHLYDDELEET